MAQKSKDPKRSLSTRLVVVRHALARHAWLRRHPNEPDKRSPPTQYTSGPPHKFNFLMLTLLVAIGFTVAVSVVQLLEAMLGKIF
jgi:hypothetical protein